MTQLSFKQLTDKKPAPGEGVHVYLLRMANALRREGVKKEDAEARIAAEYPGRREGEIADVLDKAYAAKAPPQKGTYKRKKRVQVQPADPQTQEVTWRDWLLTLFRPGEFVTLALGTPAGDKTIPNDAKRMQFERDELVKHIETAGGPAKFFEGSAGVYVCANPMPKGVRKKDKATAFRHALVEWDGTSIAKQWGIIKALNLPAASIVSSGGKSIHVLVPVNAVDAEEYEHRVTQLHEILSDYGQQDTANKDASRYTRFPGALRNGEEQRLYVVNARPQDFEEWARDAAFNKATADTERFTVADLEALQPDPSHYILGDGWVRKGAATLIIGGTGLGKSVIAVQCAIGAATGTEIFPELAAICDAGSGIRPRGAVKVVVVQAENDGETLKRDVLAIAGAMRVDMETLRHNLVIYKHPGGEPEAVMDWLAVVLDKEQPEMLLIDPYSPYIGSADINDAEAFQKFKGAIQPLLDHFQVGLLLVCHTPKPSAGRAGWNSYEKVYKAAGTSLISNWCRCSCELEVVDAESHRFLLHFAKNFDRLGIQAFGAPVREWVVEHSGNRREPFWRVSEDQSKETEETTEKQARVLGAIMSNPSASVREIAEKTGAAKSYVARLKKAAPKED